MSVVDHARERWEQLFEDDEPESGMAGLHWMAAGLFLAAGVEAALGRRRGDYRTSDAVRWAPLVAGPLAGIAHAASATFPGHTARALTRMADGIAVGVGAAGLASSVYSVVKDRAANNNPNHWQDRVPSLAPLAFCAAGLLGMLLEDEEEDALEERERLRRRARVLDRFTPERKPKLDRIVVHI